MQSRARGSSSTISTRTVPVAAGFITLGTGCCSIRDIALQNGRMERQEKSRANASAGSIRDLERGRLGPVQLGESPSRVGQTNALARRTAVGHEAFSAVSDRELEVQTHTARRDPKLRLPRPAG